MSLGAKPGWMRSQGFGLVMLVLSAYYFKWHKSDFGSNLLVAS